MKNLFVLIATLFSLQAVSQNQSITFTEKPWQEILETARAENKLIFLDAYASWCGPCKWMAKNVFTNDSVANFYNSNFINAKIDMEKGEGPELAKKYQVGAYPTLLYIDGNGEVMHRVCGSASPEQFIQIGKTAMEPKENFAFYVNRYKKGERGAAFLNDYLLRADQSCLPTDEIVASYFAGKPKEEYSQAGNWKIIYFFLEDPQSEAFNYLVQNQAKFIALYGADSVSQKLSTVFGKHLRKSAWEANRDANEIHYLEAKKKVLDSGWDGAQKIIFSSDLYAASLAKDWQKYSKLAMEGTRNYSWDKAGDLNNISWTIFEHSDDPAVVKEAITWAKRSVELAPGAANMDTYAALMFKSGQKDQAIKIQEEAIKLAEQNGEPADAYLESLNRYKAAK